MAVSRAVKSYTRPVFGPPQSQPFGPVAAPVTTDASITATVVTATVGTLAPSISTGSTVAASAVTATVSVPAPSISTATDVNISATVVTATVATIAPTVSVGSNISATVVTATVVTIAPSVSTVSTLYPASISGRKLLDQNGNVVLMPNMSSWGMATQLSNADITTALEEVAANGFKSVAVWIGGGYEVGIAPTGWNKYTNQNGDPLWTGTPWASSLGSGWSSVDWIVTECGRLGLIATLSFAGGNGTTGAGDDWEGVTNTNMYNAGVAIATRYASAPHIVWHIMLDSTHTTGSTRGTRIQNLFSGINDTEGSTTRPVRWMEVDNGATTNEQGWFQAGFFNATINAIYEYVDTSVTAFEAGWAETTAPTGDCEPPYIGAGHYGGNENQQVRERNYSVFIEGGCLINFGHEDWWTFGADGLFSAGETWDTVQATTPLVQASYCWALVDEFIRDATWAPTSGFVTTGEGTGDTKAAQGASNTAALAYFPSSRTIVVDTTIISGTGNVRLRWFDPTNNSFTSIAASEAQNASRSVTHPGNNSAGIGDWVLVVDSVGDVTISASVVTATVATLAATVSVGSTIAASVVTASVAVLTPSIAIHAAITATTVTATTTTIAPTAGAGSTASPSVVTATATTIAPSVSIHSDVTATTVTATASALTPSAAAGSTVAASVVTAPVTTIAPSVSAGSTVAANAVTATAAAIAPSISAGSTVAATVVTAPVTAIAPSVSAGADINITAATVTATAQAIDPALSTGSTIPANVVTVPVTIAAPSISTSAGASAATVTAPVTTLAPAVATGSTASTSVVTAVVGVMVPSITASTDANVSADVVTASVGTIAPTASASSTATAGVVTATVGTIAPSVSTGSDISVSADVVEVAVQVIAPTVTAGSSANVSAAVVTATAQAIAPTISTGVTISAATFTAPSQILVPSISAGSSASISAATFTATVETITPTAGSGITLSPLTITASVESILPTLSVGSTIEPSTVTAPIQVLTPTLLVGTVLHTVTIEWLVAQMRARREGPALGVEFSTDIMTARME